MAMGGDPAEARDAGGPPAARVEDENRPPVGRNNSALHDTDVERSLARFAEAAASSPNASPKIPAELEGVLREISTVGVPYYGWGALKELLAARMAEAVGSLEKESGFHQANDGKEYTQRRDDLVAALRKFEAAPFTLQRLAEVLQDPRRQYTSTHKLINGLERLLAVSSTLPVRPRRSMVARAATAAAPAISNGFNRPKPTASLQQNAPVSDGDDTPTGIAMAVVQVSAMEQRGATRVPIDEDKPMQNTGSAGYWESPTHSHTQAKGNMEGNGDDDDRSGGYDQEKGRKRLKVEAPQQQQQHQVMSE